MVKAAGLPARIVAQANRINYCNIELWKLFFCVGHSSLFTGNLACTSRRRQK